MTSIEEKVEKKSEPILPRRRVAQVIRNDFNSEKEKSAGVNVNEAVDGLDLNISGLFSHSTDSVNDIDSIEPVELELPEYVKLGHLEPIGNLSSIVAPSVNGISIDVETGMEDFKPTSGEVEGDVPLSEIAFDEDEAREIDYTFLYENDGFSISPDKKGFANEVSSNCSDVATSSTIIDDSSSVGLNLDKLIIDSSKQDDFVVCIEALGNSDGSNVNENTSVEMHSLSDSTPDIEKSYIKEHKEQVPSIFEKKHDSTFDRQSGFLAKSQMQIVVPGQVSDLKPVRKMAPLKINKQVNSFELKELNKGADWSAGTGAAHGSFVSFAQEDKYIAQIVEPIKVFKSVKVNASIISERGEVLVKGKPQAFTNIEIQKNDEHAGVGFDIENFNEQNLHQNSAEHGTNESAFCSFASKTQENVSVMTAVNYLEDDVGNQIVNEIPLNRERKVKALTAKPSNEKMSVPAQEKVKSKANNFKAFIHGFFWGYMFEVEKSIFNPVSFFVKNTSSLLLALAHIFIPIIMGFMLVNHNIQSYNFFTSGSSFVVGVKMVWLWSVCFFSWSVLFMIAGRTISALQSDATDFQRIGQGFFSPMNWNERERK